MSTDPQTPSRAERLLAYAALTIIVAAVLAYVATLIVGMNDRAALAENLWPIVVWISYIGLPIGIVLIIILLLLSSRRRGAENRRDARR